MDDQRFDRFARAVSACTSRRQLVRLLAASGVAAGLARAGGTAAAPRAATGCDHGLTYCPDSGLCVDLASDLDNCGACGALCRSDLVAVACRDGACVRADCPPALTYCGAVDLCRDLATDPLHCGACQNACPSGVCAGGACLAVGCAPGQAECGGLCVDTCCDNANCGACGNVCPPGLTCFEGICDCPSGLCCPEGEILCGDTCVATCCNNDHCGACGNACPPGESCFEGICGCPSGNCAPIQLPNTGIGTASRGDPGLRAVPWALAGAGAALLARLQQRLQPPRPAEIRPDETR
jgi:hypothetical protein